MGLIRFIVIALSAAVIVDARCSLLAILKLARSGSTWLASLLEDEFALTHEIIRVADKISGAAAEKRLLQALGENQSFTLNPKNAPRIDYHRFARKATAALGELGVVVIDFSRCNSMKHAVSYLRTREITRVCGSVQSKHCNLTALAKPNISITSLRNAFACMSERRRLIERAIREMGLPTLKVTYEDLQRDAEGTLRAIKAHAGCPEPAAKSTLELSPPRGRHAQLNVTRARTAKNVTKTGTESLRDALRNSDELANWLRATHKPCLLKQFDQKDGVCLRCPNPWPEEGCDQGMFERDGGFGAPALHPMALEKKNKKRPAQWPKAKSRS